MPAMKISYKNMITEKNAAGYYELSFDNLADRFAPSWDYRKLIIEGEFFINGEKAQLLSDTLTAFSEGKDVQMTGAWDRDKIGKMVDFCKLNSIAFDDFVRTPETYLIQSIQDIYAHYNINKLTEGAPLGEKLFLMQVGPDAEKSAPDIQMCKDIADIRTGLAELGGDEREIEENKALADLKNKLTVHNVMKYIKHPRLISEMETTIHNMLIFNDETIEEYCAATGGKFDISTGKMAKTLNIREILSDTAHHRKINYRTLSSRAVDIYQNYMKEALKCNWMDRVHEVVEALHSFAQKDYPYVNYQEKQEYGELTQTMKDSPEASQIFAILDGENTASTECSEMSKNIVLSIYGEQVRQYSHLNIWTRFFSHFSGVENKATLLRKKILETQSALIERGVKVNELKQAERPDFVRNVYPPEINFKYGVYEPVTAYDHDFIRQLSMDLMSSVDDEPNDMNAQPVTDKT